MERVKKLASGSYTFVVHTVADDGANVTAHAPYTVVVRDGAGVQVAAGTPVHTDHILTFTLSASAIQKLDTYSLTWTATVSSAPMTWTTHVEVVGGYLFEIADLRGEDRAFENATKYPTETLKVVRAWVEDVIEGPRAANVAFVPRSRRLVLNGTGRTALMLPDLQLRSVESVKVDGVAWSSEKVAALTVDDGVVWAAEAWPEGVRNVEIHYTHGYDFPPGAITRAALMLAREYLVKSDIPGRATATSIGDQLFRITVAGKDGVTGLPDVDAAIAQFGRKSYAVG